jgi:hypothetical protein
MFAHPSCCSLVSSSIPFATSIMRTQIAYIQERMDRMIDVAKGIEEETKEQQDG